LLAVALAAGTWVLGSVVAFVIVQLRTGQGDLLDRLSAANFSAFMGGLLEPPLLQLAVFGAYVIVAWITTRPRRPPDRKPAR
jgi:hypothetical protein